MKAIQAISNEIALSKLVVDLVQAALDISGAQKGCLLLARGGELSVEAAARDRGQGVVAQRSVPLGEADDLSHGVVRFVQQTAESVVLADAAREGAFTADAYVATRRPRSILCLPITHQGQLVGVLYLENDQAGEALRRSCVMPLQTLCSQVAMAIVSSRRYSDLEGTLRERTAELREAQAKVIHLEGNAIDKRMAGGFAHEIRNALAGSKLVVGRTLGDGYDEPQASMPMVAANELGELFHSLSDRLNGEDVARIHRILDKLESLDSCLRVISEAIGRALNITKHVIDYSRIDESKQATGRVDINNVIHSTLAELSESLNGRAISVIADVEGSIRLHGDETQYYTIIQNLVNNARDAVVAREDGGGAIEVSARVEDGRCVVEVKDNGIGIKKGDMGRLFSVFYSTKPETGTGLGLAMTKKVVDMIGGEIDVQSEWGKGSRFTVVIPM